jgi:predicted N-acetyltransferase YhbS
METVLRPAVPEDAEPCGRICWDAFTTLAERHGFPSDFPAPEVGIGVIEFLTQHPGFYGVVAERDGRVVGSNFLDERSPIAGVGPLTVDPAVQDAGIGRRLMLDVLARAEAQGFGGVRLLQSAYNVRSLSLYAKLGFQVREALAVMQGAPPAGEFPGRPVRAASAGDADACDRLCERVHGHHRGGELRDAIEAGAARVVERDGRIAGYTTGIGFFAHSVAESGDDLRALIAAADDISGPGFLLPLRDAELFRWALEGGLRVVSLMTLMTVGQYDEPAGAYLPSVLY